MPQSASPEAVARWFARYHETRDPRDRERLAIQFLPLARHFSRAYDSAGEREDLEQVARLALLKAIDRFDPTRGIAFTSFAVPTILGEIKRYFRDLGWSVRVPRRLQELSARVDRASTALAGELGRFPTAAEVAERCEVTEEDVVEARVVTSAHRAESLDRPMRDAPDLTLAETLPHEDPGYDSVERRADLDRLLATLPSRQREVLRLRFEEDLLQREIAERIGTSQMHVSRLIGDALQRLEQAAG